MFFLKIVVSYDCFQHWKGPSIGSGPSETGYRIAFFVEKSAGVNKSVAWCPKLEKLRFVLAMRCGLCSNRQYGNSVLM